MLSAVSRKEAGNGVRVQRYGAEQGFPYQATYRPSARLAGNNVWAGSGSEPPLQPYQLGSCSCAIDALEYHEAIQYLSFIDHCTHTSFDGAVAQAAACTMGVPHQGQARWMLNLA